MPKDVIGFQGEYRYLSNFYPSDINYQGVIYPTVENAFQAAKTTDLIIRDNFIDCSPSTATRLGGCNGIVILRPDWEEKKYTLMLFLLQEKFKHEHLRELLLLTGKAQLIEENDHGDRVWGTVNGDGQNLLGKALMQIRESLRKKK